MVDTIIEYYPLLLRGLGQTVYMTFASALFSYIIGLPLGVALFCRQRGLIKGPSLSWLINIGRSIPFAIIMVAIIPFTRLVTGSFIGPTAAIVPLVVAAVPFVARLVESALAEVDGGLIEACSCMGATTLQLITGVLLPEALPSLVRGFSIAAITLLGYIAMAGAMGAGGLGDIAIRYGFHRWQPKVMYLAVILLIALVAVIQITLTLVAKKADKK